MFNSSRGDISKLPGATELGNLVRDIDHLPASTWLYIGQLAIDNGVPELPTQAPESSDTRVSLEQWKAIEEHRMSLHGKEMVGQVGQPTVKGIVGLLEGHRQELGKRYEGSGMSGVYGFARPKTQSHFVEFLRDNTGVGERTLHRTIGQNGLAVSIDMQNPPARSYLMRRGAHGARHALIQYNADPTAKEPLVNERVAVVLNADADREYANVFTAAPFTGQANIAATPGALEALLLDVQKTIDDTTERYGRMYPDR